MPVAKITKSLVERVPRGEWLWDRTVVGFGTRRQQDGIYYYLRWREGGRQRMRSIGRHGSPWTVEQARKEAQRLLGVVAAGQSLDRPQGGETFGALAQRYLERKRASMKPRAFAEVERHLTIHARPLARLPLAEIDRRRVAECLGAVESGSGIVARNRVRSCISTLGAWAVTEGLLEANPVAGTAKLDEGGSRERVLTDAELAAVWSEAGAGDFGDIVRLLMLTGQRREEMGGVRWNEVDFARGVIVLPPERTKNRREHVVPLSTQARAIIEARSSSKRDFVFGAGKGPYSGWSRAKTALDQRIRRRADPKAKPMPEWRLHDLRRTAATGMASIGVLPHIVEAVLNHVSGHKGGVAGIYNRARYEAEMREALQRWGDHVAKFVEEEA